MFIAAARRREHTGLYPKGTGVLQVFELDSGKMKMVGETQRQHGRVLALTRAITLTPEHTHTLNPKVWLTLTRTPG